MLTWKTFTIGRKLRTMQDCFLKSAFLIRKEQQSTLNANKTRGRV